MASQFTSVPRPVGGLEPPDRAREIVAFSFSAEGTRATEAFLERRTAGTPYRHLRSDCADATALAELRDVVRESRIGVRFIFGGPQADIYAARAESLRNGAIDGEINLLETDTATLRVYCAHCVTTTSTRTPIGGTVTCAGCSQELVVYHHFSRRAASYLGFKVNAEEIP